MNIQHKKIEKIPIFLILTDISSIIFTSIITENKFIISDIPNNQLVARYLIFTIFPFIQLILNTYKPLSFDLRIGFIIRYLIGCIIYFLIISVIISVTQIRYIGNAWGRGWFFLNIFAFFSLGFFSRLIIKYYKIHYVDKIKMNLILICSQNNLLNLFKELDINNNNINCLVYSNEYIKNENQFYIRNELDLIIEIKKLESENINYIVIDNNFSVNQETYSEIVQSSMRGVFIFELSNFVEIFSEKFPVLITSPNWIITSGGFGYFYKSIQERIKILVDFILCLIFFLPFFILILIFALLIKLSSKGEVLFKQSRVGKNGKIFTLYKLRSMSSSKDLTQKWAQENDPRITKIGKFIRITRIDELPQIINILKGDMSFIGPRPEQPDIVDNLNREIPFYNLRHMIKPGLTGWAQVNYGYGSSIDDSRIKLEYDLYYLKNYSLFLDLRIFIKTLRVIIFGRGR